MPWEKYLPTLFPSAKRRAGLAIRRYWSRTPATQATRLGWKPQHSELGTIIQDAWNWHSSGNRR